MIEEDFAWIDKYRPKKVSECILPASVKGMFQTYVDKGNLPNLLLTGTPGIGKTSSAIAALTEMDCDWIKINSSLEGNMDTLRTKIKDFASTTSFKNGRKYVILDEADGLTFQSQPAFRAFLDDFSSSCGFIFTANYANKIIEPLHSRLTIINFKIKAEDKQQLGKEFIQRMKDILDAEKVTYDKEVIKQLLVKTFPDFRKAIQTLQVYSGQYGTIDVGVLQATEITKEFSELIALLKSKSYPNIRKWVGNNTNIEFQDITRGFYDQAQSLVDPKAEPVLVTILADYLYKAAFALDKEILLSAMLVEIMSEVVWK